MECLHLQQSRSWGVLTCPAGDACRARVNARTRLHGQCRGPGKTFIAYPSRWEGLKSKRPCCGNGRWPPRLRHTEDEGLPVLCTLPQAFESNESRLCVCWPYFLRWQKFSCAIHALDKIGFVKIDVVPKLLCAVSAATVVSFIIEFFFPVYCALRAFFLQPANCSTSADKNTQSRGITYLHAKAKKHKHHSTPLRAA